MGQPKTNAQRSLEQQRVAYIPHTYETKDGLLDAVSVAEKIKMPAGRVFKTLVTRSGPGSVLIFVVPGNCELDLKAAARAAGEKAVEMVPVSDIMPLTGYMKGGCSPIGIKKHYPMFVDQSALNFETIVVSAGKIGMQIELTPADLAKVCKGNFAPIAKAM